MNKVIVGIVSKHFLKNYNRPDIFIKEELKQAIYDNEAIAIGILPTFAEKIRATNTWTDRLTKKEKEDLLFQLKLCDGIILQGGGFSDEYECFIAKFCYDNDIPILGICAGMNNMVRAVGGIIEKFEGLEYHKSEENYVHEIIVENASIFYDIVGKEKINVNSRHDSYVSNCGPLVPAAYSLDGIIEAVEDKSKKFYLAVQFHPETLYEFDENMNKIFQYFINVCLMNKI